MKKNIRLFSRLLARQPLNKALYTGNRRQRNSRNSSNNENNSGVIERRRKCELRLLRDYKKEKLKTQAF